MLLLGARHRLSHTYRGCTAHHVLRVLNSYRTLPTAYLPIEYSPSYCTLLTAWLTCYSLSTCEVRVIAYGLYGADARYTVGVLRNAQLAPLVYPGWKVLSE